MIETRQRRRESLLETYCSQLGTLLERGSQGLGLVAAKQQAETAAMLANEGMLEAKASDRAKTKFLANMSHELRTPLNAIIGFSEIIKLDEHHPRDRYPEYARYIHDAGTLLLDIINGLLDLARIEAGKVELDEQLVDLEEVIQAGVTTLSPLAERKSIVIDSRYEQPALWICVDQTKFKQILLNLLSNAVKFTDPGGHVMVESRLDGHGDLVIVVRDTGVGIAREHLAKVLEPFEQVEDHLTRRNEGTGLGLPIARALIELHGGQLVLSSDIGVGTSAELRVPRERVGVARYSIPR
jgi:two-component system cell cycle sensor histidine kinase PleC